MEKDIRSNIKYASTSSEIWSDLRERFGKESAPRAYELKNKIADSQQDGAIVSTYYTKLRSLWDEIQSVFPVPQCTCNGCTCDIGKRLVEHQEKERLYEFLMGLDSQFGVIRTQILATNPIPGLGTAYHLVAEDERQRLITEEKKPTSEAAAFKTFVPARRDSTSSSQQKTNHTQNRQSKMKRSFIAPNAIEMGMTGIVALSGLVILIGGQERQRLIRTS